MNEGNHCLCTRAFQTAGTAARASRCTQTQTEGEILPSVCTEYSARIEGNHSVLLRRWHRHRHRQPEGQGREIYSASRLLCPGSAPPRNCCRCQAQVRGRRGCGRSSKDAAAVVRSSLAPKQEIDARAPSPAGMPCVVRGRYLRATLLHRCPTPREINAGSRRHARRGYPHLQAAAARAGAEAVVSRAVLTPDSTGRSELPVRRRGHSSVDAVPQRAQPDVLAALCVSQPRCWAC